jgi:histidyl-tRNA synthetase
MSSASIPKGTRDFLPQQAAKRNYLFEVLRSVFVKYGYEPIETPAMESLSTLMGKYGEEGDKLIFKILNSGPVIEQIQNSKSEIRISEIVEKALRYDLTVPFARFVVQHQNDITFPFKRYQIQPVWRADKPQKGRYREFYQCDVDVVGSDSLLNEIELIQIIDEVFGLLKIPVTIKINNRKILSGIAEIIEEKEKIVDITVAIDKLSKIGIDGVIKELKEKGISDDAINRLHPILNFSGNSVEKLNMLKHLLSKSETGMKGINELEYIFNIFSSLKLKFSELETDITLARGLNYYTGAIFEVVTKNFPSSICGGGRYDDLTGIFGLKNVSGVGISFGADRIYDVMNEQSLFPEALASSTQVMFTNFGDNEMMYCLPVLIALREKGVKAELYPDCAKMKKQMKYADSKNIPFVVLAGESEINSNSFTLKNMKTGEQSIVSANDLYNYFR